MNVYYKIKSLKCILLLQIYYILYNNIQYVIHNYFFCRCCYLVHLKIFGQQVLLSIRTNTKQQKDRERDGDERKKDRKKKKMKCK